MNLVGRWRGRGTGHLECRRCGTTLEGSAGGCPVCGADDVVHYPQSVLE